MKGTNENHRSESYVWFVILKVKIIDLIRPKRIPLKIFKTIFYKFYYLLISIIYILCTKRKKMRREIGTGHSKFFFFFFWLGCGLGPNLAGLNEAHGARRARQRQVRAPGKNPVSKRVEFGLRAKTRGSGPGMKKPGPNPTRCHSY